jgi:hypothetical protein
MWFWKCLARRKPGRYPHLFRSDNSLFRHDDANGIGFHIWQLCLLPTNNDEQRRTTTNKLYRMLRISTLPRKYLETYLLLWLSMSKSCPGTNIRHNVKSQVRKTLRQSRPVSPSHYIQNLPIYVAFTVQVGAHWHNDHSYDFF